MPPTLIRDDLLGTGRVNGVVLIMGFIEEHRRNIPHQLPVDIIVRAMKDLSYPGIPKDRQQWGEVLESQRIHDKILEPCR